MEEKTQVPFSGTLAQELQLKEVIAARKEQPGCLMPVLQQAQEIYGYLPIEVQAIVAEGLGISLSEVYGVATFYSQFRLNPKGILHGHCFQRRRRKRRKAENDDQTGNKNHSFNLHKNSFHFHNVV